MNLFAIPTLLGAVFSLVLGLFSLARGRRSKQNVVFALMCLTIVIWLLAYSITYSTKDVKIAIIYARIACTAVVMLAPTFYHFIVTFLKIKKEQRNVVIFYIFGLVFLYLFLFTNYLLSGVHAYFWGYYSKAGPLHPLFLLFFFFMFAKGTFLLYGVLRHYDEPSPVRYAQIKYVFIGLIVIGLAGIDFIPKYGIEFYPFGFLFVLIFVGITAYAILRYRLMDIRVAFTNAGIFLILYTVVLGIPFWIGISTHSWVYSTSAAVIVATIGPLVYRFLQKKTENLLLAQQRRYQKILLQASVGMIREHNLSRLSKLLVYVVKKTVKVTFTTIFLNNKDQQLYKLQAIRNSGSSAYEISFLYEHPFIMYLKTKDAPFLYEEMPQYIKNSLNIPLPTSLIIPFLIDNTLLGFSFLGEKLNRQPYSEDDINVFRILSHQVAMAISNCVFFEEFKNAQEKIFNAEKLASIGGMADGIAHQIKNRLNHFSVASGEMQCEIEDYIKNHPQLMVQNPDLKKSFEYVHQIADSLIKNVKHTDSIIKGILNFARTEEKETFFNYFSVGEVINLALQLLKVKHEIQDFPLKANLSDNDLIFGVKSQIMESLYNILDNCFEALMEKKQKLTPEERENFKPLITLELTQHENFSLILIADNGIGIKEEDRHKIFAPFFTTKSSYKSGSGIGMYVVKRMIEENHHGKITFQSTYLEGVKFRIELPVKK